MNLKHLQTFLTLSEIKNFTKTADYLHYAQSNVTTQIQQLEEELNVKLFERIGKSVTLTSEGEDLIPYANKILALTKDIRLKLTGQNTGRISIGASESICIYRLPEIIKSFQIAYPAVELYLHVLDSDDFTPYLDNNMIDLAFILDTKISAPDIRTALQINEAIGLFSIPGHPLAQKPLVSVRDFADQRLILTGKDCCYRKKFESELFHEGITPKIVLETGSLHVIKQTVLSGLGICLLPQLAVQKELDHGTLVKINYLTNYNISSQLIFHKDKWISQNLNNLITFIQQMI